MTTKEEDGIMSIRYCETHDNILFFTNKGKAYQLKAYEINESSRTSKGTAVINLISIEPGEKVESFVTYSKGDLWNYVFLTTRKGTVKKSKLSDFENIRRGGILAIKLSKGDELVWSNLTTGKDEVHDLITIMDKGLGKKTRVEEYHSQSRGGQGVKIAQITEKTGKVAASQVIPKGFAGIILTSTRGQIVKLDLNSIPRLSRATSGVILMRFSNPNDRVASITCIEE